MIDYWHHLVVRLSVFCKAVHCGLPGRWLGVQDQKLHKCVPSRHIHIWQFRHFCCKMYRLATKRTGKNELKKMWTWVILRHRKPHVHWFSVHYLLLRTWDDQRSKLCSWWTEFGCITYCWELEMINVANFALDGLSLGAFIKSYRLNRTAHYSRNRFVLVIPYFVRSTIGYHSNSWASRCAYVQLQMVNI